MLNGSVLVLNATYEPLNIVSVKRAIILVLKEKAEIIEAAEAKLRSENLSLPLPLVIRLVTYVKVPRYVKFPLTRKTVFARDHYTCQYCGRQLPKSELTLDHVIPRQRGGETTWENVVTACKTCNQRKGSRTPQEAGMRLLSKPTRPRYIAFVLLSEARHNEVWSKYLNLTNF
ncbi:MAG: HNH endonuclease [Chloroflexi bacterium]|nr:MAG: HNH endonuclease [Chloroflexota bacterium]HDN80012.1 HNH endonuclease [Chloroflexota bacterium]